VRVAQCCPQFASGDFVVCFFGFDGFAKGQDQAFRTMKNQSCRSKRKTKLDKTRNQPEKIIRIQLLLVISSKYNPKHIKMFLLKKKEKKRKEKKRKRKEKEKKRKGKEKEKKRKRKEKKREKKSHKHTSMLPFCSHSNNPMNLSMLTPEPGSRLCSNKRSIKGTSNPENCRGEKKNVKTKQPKKVQAHKIRENRLKLYKLQSVAFEIRNGKVVNVLHLVARETPKDGKKSLQIFRSGEQCQPL
jgi:hypothetical protein